ncbi:GNAT family N-acetyltransferase [Micromonospora sp. NPDC051227]|uniref:GNAT family N-acetyltransferase n=1 Tax=Micromonospora sp. NPDC051227 TaxID=3364285 RepID=UPI0037A60167
MDRLDRRAGETLYHLEMRSPDDVQASRPLPADVTLSEQRDPLLIRAVTLSIGQPYDWPSQHWNDSRWADHLNRHNLRHWTVQRAGDILGLASLRFDQAEVELDTFGLVPRHVGTGLGGPFLALVAELAWREAPQTERLWLHTSSADHPYALRNYLARGFRQYRPVLPTDW